MRAKLARAQQRLAPKRGSQNVVAVEMEAAALYALSAAKEYPIVCFAHVTNTMAQAGDDFEKGPDWGSPALLAVIGETARCWRHGS